MKKTLSSGSFCFAALIAVALFFSTQAFSQAWTFRAGFGQSVTGANEFGKAICADASGNVYMTGEFAGTVDFGSGTGLTSAGAFDGFVASYTSAGAFRWAIRFGGGGNDQGIGIATNGTDVYITGNFNDNATDMTVGTSATVYPAVGSTDVFVIKLNASTGATSWVTTFGGAGAEIGQAITLDASGNVYVSGNFSNGTTFGAAGVRNVQGGTGTDLFVTQLNSSGTIVWASTGGGVNTNDNITGSGICYVPGSGEIVVTGSVRSDGTASTAANYTTASPVSSVSLANSNASLNNTDFVLLEITASNGAFISGSAVGSTNNEEGLAATYDAATQDVFFTGFFSSASVTFPGTSAITNTGGGGVNNIFYGRYNPSTNAYSWVREVENSVPASADDVGTALVSNGSGAIWVTGYFRNTTSFPTASTALTLTSASLDDPFLVKLDGATGNAIFATQGSGDDPLTNDRSNGVAYATGENLWITGQYAGSLTFSPLSALASSGDGQDIFIAKFNEPPAHVTSVNVPSNGTYIIGQNLDFTVNWDIPVTVTGTPQVPLTIGASAKNASYVSGNGTKALLFRYTVVSGDLDNNGIAVGASISLNGGTIKNIGTSLNATLTLNSVGSTALVNVDGVAPTVTSINRQTPSTATTTASTLVYRVTFSESVTGVDISDFTLTTTSGTATGTIASVSASSGTVIDVTVNSVAPSGTLRLDLKASGTGITDVPGNPISGGFTSGQTYTIVPPITADFTATPGTCTGDNRTVDFSATASGGNPGGTGYTYSWDFGDGSPAGSGASPSHSYVSGATYTVVLTVSDADGNSDQASHQVTVDACCPAPSVSVTSSDADNIICAGTSVTFTAHPVNGGATPTYQWKKNGSDILSETNSTYTTSTLANNDLVTVAMTSSETCSAGTVVTATGITTTVNPNLAVSVSISSSDADNIICAGTSVTFTATPTNGGSSPSYQWKKNNVDVGTNSATYTTTALANGDEVKVILTSSEACTTGNPATSNTITTTVNANLPVSVSISSSDADNIICAGTSVTFTATPTNGGSSPSYQWKKNNIDVGTNSATYTTTGLANGDQVKVILTSSEACTTGNPATSNTITTTVNANLPVSVSISSSDADNTICAGTSVTFTATPTNGGSSPSYQWKKNNVDVGTNSATYTTTSLANGDQVKVILTSSETCASGNPATSNTITTTVNPNLAVSVSISSSDADNTICAGTSVTFTATPTNGGSSPSYQWKKNNVDVGTNSATYTTTSLANGDQVKVILTSSEACTSGNPATSNTITTTVNPILPVSVSISSSDADNTICAGTSVTFTATPTNGGSSPAYQWKKNNVDVGTNSATYTTTSLANGDQVKVILTSSEACTSGNPATSNTITTTVNPNLPVSVSISSSDADNMICAGTSVTFTATPTNGGSSPSYQWKKNNVDVGTNSATYTTTGLANGDQVKVVLTSSEACTTGNPATSNTITTSVNAIPEVTPHSFGSVQFGDVVNASVNITDDGAGSALSFSSPQWKLGAGSYTNGLPAGLSLSLGTATAHSVPLNLTGTANLALGVYTIKVLVSDGTCSQYQEITLTVVKEKLCAEYNGQLSVSAVTLSKNANKATIALSVGLADTDGQGDITQATVEFKLEGYNSNNWFAVPVQSLNSPTNSIGNATKIVDVTFTGDWASLDFDYRITGSYEADANCSDQGMSVITVYIPQNEFITGGGYVIIQNSVGLLPADANRRANFGFNVKYTKSGTNLKGNINYVFRHLENDGIVHLYQVKGNAMSSLTVNAQDASENNYKTAVFNGKCNVSDITTGTAVPVSGTGNSLMQIMITDGGNSGSNDKYAITIWNSANQLYHSSNWVSVKTVKQLISAGNILIQGNTSVGVSATTVTTVSAGAKEKEITKEFDARVLPNPSGTFFTLLISGNNNEAISLKVTDLMGRIIETKTNLAVGQTLRIGDVYRQGVYFAELRQGDKIKLIKLIKSGSN
jgi:hypothetical protein